ncbi:hypothetical protein NDU88_005591 [Pleurodeles waltl]|uniref:Uncharacterized protein n=1 Tax=Pleurodeles waltl TaxID=8319 RepID=A0AAV7L5A0_PLEWA|nr:hypothetical protein NDU88_005591 [Pleurodeles waltl]
MVSSRVYMADRLIRNAESMRVQDLARTGVAVQAGQAQTRPQQQEENQSQLQVTQAQPCNDADNEASGKEEESRGSSGSHDPG